MEEVAMTRGEGEGMVVGMGRFWTVILRSGYAGSKRYSGVWVARCVKRFTK